MSLYLKIIIILFLLILSFYCGTLFALKIKKFHKQSIMVDFDGVLNDYQYYDKHNLPKIKDGAKEFVEELSKNYVLVIFTTREKNQTKKWLKENGLDKYFEDITSVKYPATIYLDDRAIQFRGDFNETLKDIKNFKPYWK